MQHIGWRTYKKKRTLRDLQMHGRIISNACREIWCEQIGTNIPEEPVVHLLEYKKGSQLKIRYGGRLLCSIKVFCWSHDY